MDCKCQSETCHYTMVSGKLIEAWENFRHDWGEPTKINSAYRCQTHNENVGGVPNSRHTLGNALDLEMNEYCDKIKMVHLARRHFDYVKIYPTFLHCDVRNG